VRQLSRETFSCMVPVAYWLNDTTN